MPLSDVECARHRGELCFRQELKRACYDKGLRVEAGHGDGASAPSPRVGRAIRKRVITRAARRNEGIAPEGIFLSHPVGAHPLKDSLAAELRWKGDYQLMRGPHVVATPEKETMLLSTWPSNWVVVYVVLPMVQRRVPRIFTSLVRSGNVGRVSCYLHRTGNIVL